MAVSIDLHGRTALVTGAGSGVGRSVALRLAAAGAELVVNDIDGHAADAVAGLARRAGARATSAVFDVGDHDAVTAALERVGAVDILVNNAGNAGTEGFGSRGPFAESEPGDWEPFLRINLYGVMNCVHTVLPGMIGAGWGRILTVVSDAGRTGDSGGAAYGAAKAGAAGLTRSIALENGRHGITANNISLGTMRTEATDAFWSDPESPAARELMRDYVIRRPGEPDEVAALVVFLSSDGARWVTGQTYPLNGGYSFAL